MRFKELEIRMEEVWTFKDENLFEAVVKQAMGEHIDEDNDLCAKISYAKALQELLDTAKLGTRDSGTNGFIWYNECRDFFERHKKAVLAWFDKYKENFGGVYEDSTALLVDMQGKNKMNLGFDVGEDLLDGGLLTKALIVRQLMYEIACDLCDLGYKVKGDEKIA